MSRYVALAILAVAQLVLVGVGVAPQLSARLTGETHLLRVEPLDPIDPFRGSYVTLQYPDLQVGDEDAFAGTSIGSLDDGESGTVYITLVERDGVWVGDGASRRRPTTGTFMACDDSSWQIRCGIESFFASSSRAAQLEEELQDGAYAEVRIDSRGNASVVDVRDQP
jgi:uncharacterized membrane-anchored protein